MNPEYTIKNNDAESYSCRILMLYNVSVKSAMGFILLRIGTEASNAVLTLTLIIPDKKERNSELNTPIITFVFYVSLGIEPIQRPKAVPNRFA